MTIVLLIISLHKLEQQLCDLGRFVDFGVYRSYTRAETLRLQLKQMRKDRDSAEQKNAEQLEKLKNNCRNPNDDETSRSKLPIYMYIKTTMPKVVLQKLQFPVQDGHMSKVKQREPSNRCLVKKHLRMIKM